METVDGMPVRMVNPAQPEATEEEKHLIGDEGDAGALLSDSNQPSATREKSEPGEQVMSKKSRVRLKRDVES